MRLTLNILYMRATETLENERVISSRPMDAFDTRFIVLSKRHYTMIWKRCIENPNALYRVIY